MVLHYIMSLGVGIVGGVLVGAFWVFIHYMKVRNRCNKVLEIVITNMKEEGNEKLLPWYCTKDFIHGDMDLIMDKIHGFGNVIIVDKFRVQLMKHVDYALNIIVAFEMQHQNGRSTAQVIMRRTPSSVKIHEFAIF